MPDRFTLLPRPPGRRPPIVGSLVACLLAAAAVCVAAAPKTVCTVTINSADERDTFQRFLPRDKYRFVELVESGRPDWLAAACRRDLRCDALIISGHFDGGTEFYTDRFEDREFLAVSELERASCSASCSGLFARLEEVYLFGCNTLKSEPSQQVSAEIARSLVRDGRTPADAEQHAVRLGQRYGQSNRDRLRHVFKDVPVLYGFASKAPLGRSAGPLLQRYFQSAPPDEVASGQVSSTLVKLFAPSSMTVASGLTDTDPDAALRADVCGFADEQRSPAQQMALLHRLLQRDMAEVRLWLDRLEPLADRLFPLQGQSPDAAAAGRAIAEDRATRARYIEFARDADGADVQARMLALARRFGWLTPAQAREEWVRMIVGRMAQGALGRAEVDLVCSSPHAGEPGLAGQVLASGAARPDEAAHAAVLACLGDRQAHGRVLQALTGASDADAAIAQAYLRRRPLADPAELRALASGIGQLGAPALQVRALDALARHRLADAESLKVIAQLFVQARSLEVQRAAAGLLIRADLRQLVRADLARMLQKYRLKSPDGGDVIDALIRLLQT